MGDSKLADYTCYTGRRFDQNPDNSALTGFLNDPFASPYARGMTKNGVTTNLYTPPPGTRFGGGGGGTPGGGVSSHQIGTGGTTLAGPEGLGTEVAGESGMFGIPGLGIDSIIKGVGAGLQMFGRGADRKSNEKITRAELIDRALGDQENNDLTRAQVGLNATQLNPYASSEFLNRANVLRQVLSGASNRGYSFDPATGTGKFTGGFQIPEGGFDVSALSPESLGESAKDFYSARADANPNLPTPNFSSYGLDPAKGKQAEDFRTLRASDLERRRQQRMNYINQILGK